MNVRGESVADEISTLTEQYDAITVDERVLELTSRVEALAGMKARHLTAEDDIPNRKLELREVEARIDGILKALGRDGEPDAKRLLLDAATTGRIRALIEQHSGLQTGLDAAKTETESAAQLLAEADERCAKAGVETSNVSDVDITALAATLTALRAGDHLARERRGARTIDKANAQLAQSLHVLQPWTGGADDLVKMSVPVLEDIQRWKAASAEAETQIVRYDGDVERLTTAIGRHEAERDVLGAASGIVSDADAGDVRAEREKAWAHHRQALSTDTADVFETSLRKDDLIAAARLAHTADVAKHHKVAEATAIAISDRDRAQELLDQHTRHKEKIEADLAAAIRSISPELSPAMSLSQLEAWLTKRSNALEARSALEEAKRDLLDTEDDRKAASKALRQALAKAGHSFGEGEPFDRLQAAAEAAIDTARAAIALAADAKQKREALARRNTTLDSAKRAVEKFKAAWREACSASWLGGEVTLATVKEILVVISELGPALDKRDGLADRIEKMSGDQHTFKQAVLSVADSFSLPVENNMLGLSQAITEKSRLALSAREKKVSAAAALADANDRQRTLADLRKIHDALKHEMTDHFSVATLQEVSGKLGDIDKRADLELQIAAATADILESVRVTDLAAAEASLDAADRSALEAELIELKARFDDQDVRSRDLFTAQSKAHDQVEAVGGGDDLRRLPC